ncbi:MAG: DUF839 domain-containing protein [Myxococcota bacterium]|nr:DUF839 domain-containing protein [Myxococcota bacterium]
MRRQRPSPLSLPMLSRRSFLGHGLRSAGALGLGLVGTPALAPEARAAAGGADSFGPLQPPDANGLRLPPGFSSRVVAVSNQLVDGTAHTWHPNPDGGATFATGDGGWVYVSNSESGVAHGGVGAIRFAADGSIVDAYRILTGTVRNCAGGPTPWSTWLSCEEVNGGEVYECDPFTAGSEGVVRPALGTFNHEAAAVDPVFQQVYLTEDKPDGLLYRFTPASYPDLRSGTLEVAEVLGAGAIQPGEVRSLRWHPVLDPNPTSGGIQDASHRPPEERATRYQVPDATPFDGGEGCWFESGRVYFSTKGDNRVWLLDTANDTLEILYDMATASDPELVNADNVYVSSLGDVYVAEDPGNLQIVALTVAGDVKPVVEITEQTGTEVTGPALSPDGSRLYFSSQRNPGTTYEVAGPFAPVTVPNFDVAWRTLFAVAVGGAAAYALRWRKPHEEPA